MKNIKSILILSLFILLFGACSQNPENGTELEAIEIVKKENTDLIDAPFVADTSYDFKLYGFTSDTFRLVSNSPYFYYSFGKFYNSQQLKDHFGDKFKFMEEISTSRIEPSEKDTLYRVIFNGGFIKYYQTSVSDVSDETEMALISAKITEPSAQMTNGLKVGLTRDEVKDILFSKGEPKGIRNYNNILIATALDGMWVHLNFDKDRLSKIVIDTDYQLNKE